MSIVDRVFIGKVVMKSDVLEEDAPVPWVRRERRFLVSKRRGTFQLVLRQVERCWGMPCAVHYECLSEATLTEIRRALHQELSETDLTEHITKLQSIDSWLDEAQTMFKADATGIGERSSE